MSLSISVSIQGVGRVYERAARVNRVAPEIVKDATKKMAEALKREVGDVLFESSNGTTWNSYNPAWKYWWKSYGSPSAAPGEPINYQTGQLWQSITINPYGSVGHVFDVTAPYAKYHELLGWTSYYGNSIAPRPFVRPAHERAVPEYNKIVENAGRRMAQ